MFNDSPVSGVVERLDVLFHGCRPDSLAKARLMSSGVVLTPPAAATRPWGLSGLPKNREELPCSVPAVPRHVRLGCVL
jgi:hypothetical protein